MAVCYFSVLLINEQLIATNSPNRIHGNAAPKKSLTILHSSFQISICQAVRLQVSSQIFRKSQPDSRFSLDLSAFFSSKISRIVRQIVICTSECNYISTTVDFPSDLSPFNHFHFSNNSILPLSKICGILWQTPIRTCFCSFMCR